MHKIKKEYKEFTTDEEDYDGKANKEYFHKQ